LFLNANSAAFYQLLGFVPLMLASPSKNVAMILGAVLLPTMLLTGSMGATLSLLTGMAVAITAIVLSGHLLLIIKIFVRVGIALVLLSGIAYFIISHNERYQHHFDQIFLGRAEKSSGGRFDLWQRGYDAYVDNDVFLLGVGPENFREVDPTQKDNQLHNDFLAFSVERGLLGLLGLALFVIVAASRATYMILLANKYPDRATLAVVVFLAAIVATVVNSQIHQMFHFRNLWAVLALQEALLFKMTATQRQAAPTTRMLNGSRRRPRGLIAQPDITKG
jgi:O-antigen ligase